MYRPNARLLVGLLPVIAIIALACGSDSDSDNAQRVASIQTPLPAAPSQAAPPAVPTAVPVAAATVAPAAVAAVEEVPLSAEDVTYLNKTATTFGLTDTNFNRFQRIFRQAWPVRSQLIRALLEAGVGETFIPTQEALKSISPPERLVDDHALFVAHIDELVGIDGEIRNAVENGDLAAMSLANGELEQELLLFWSNPSRQFCLAFSRRVRGVDRAACKLGSTVPGGAYGSQMNAVMREYMPSLGGIMGTLGFPLSLSDEELVKVFTQVNQQAQDLLTRTQAKLASLEPPDDLRPDHERFLQLFFEEAEDIFEQMKSAIDSGDINAARTQAQRLGPAICEARRGISSPEFRRIVGELGPPCIFGGFGGR